MFGLNTDKFPRLSNFEEAEHYLNTTKPIKSGENTGRVPLRTNRRNADTYHIYESKHENPFGQKGMQRTIVCHMYAEQVLIYYADGTIEINPYLSRTTNDVQSALLQGVANVHSVCGHKRLAIDVDRVWEHSWQPFLYEPLTTLSHCCRVLFANHQPIYLVPAGSSYKRYTIHNYGVAVDAQRRYYDETVGAAVRTAQKALRQMSLFSDTTTFPEITGSYLGYTSSLTARYVHLHEGLKVIGWKPGQQATHELFELLLDTRRDVHYLERMSHLGNLRIEPKYAANGCLARDPYTVLHVSDAEDLLIEIEQIRQGAADV